METFTRVYDGSLRFIVIETGRNMNTFDEKITMSKISGEFIMSLGLELLTEGTSIFQLFA